MRRLLFLVAFLSVPMLAFAQEGGSVAVGFSLKSIIAVLITGVGIPVAVQLLKQFWPMAPGWLKTFAPVVLPPLAVAAAAQLSAWLGVVIDFQDIIDVMMTSMTVGVAATTAFKLGKQDPQMVGRKSKRPK